MCQKKIWRKVWVLRHSGKNTVTIKSVLFNFKFLEKNSDMYIILHLTSCTFPKCQIYFCRTVLLIVTAIRKNVKNTNARLQGLSVPTTPNLKGSISQSYRQDFFFNETSPIQKNTTRLLANKTWINRPELWEY